MSSGQILTLSSCQDIVSFRFRLRESILCSINDSQYVLTTTRENQQLFVRRLVAAIQLTIRFQYADAIAAPSSIRHWTYTPFDSTTYLPPTLSSTTTSSVCSITYAIPKYLARNPTTLTPSFRVIIYQPRRTNFNTTTSHAIRPRSNPQLTQQASRPLKIPPSPPPPTHRPKPSLHLRSHSPLSLPRYPGRHSSPPLPHARRQSR